MIELEAKVWIDKHSISLEEIREKLKNIAKFKAQKLKEDIYFQKENAKSVCDLAFRIRKQLVNNKKEFIVTAKNRCIKEGIETNTETEFTISSYEAFTQFAEQMNFKEAYRKKKETKEFVHNGFTIELNFVEGLGWFLEIEKLCEESELEIFKKALEEEFLIFGFTQKDFEQKPYAEILSEQGII